MIETAFPLTMLRNTFQHRRSNRPRPLSRRLRHGPRVSGRCDQAAGALQASLGRSVTPPWGVDGGTNGSTNYYEVVRTDGSIACAAAEPPVFQLAQGDIVRIVTGNGGGWGSPIERDPTAIARDLADELIIAKTLPSLWRRRVVNRSLRVAVDIGGTFTDAVIYDPVDRDDLRGQELDDSR